MALWVFQQGCRGVLFVVVLGFRVAAAKGQISGKCMRDSGLASGRHSEPKGKKFKVEEGGYCDWV